MYFLIKLFFDFYHTVFGDRVAETSDACDQISSGGIIVKKTKVIGNYTQQVIGN